MAHCTLRNTAVYFPRVKQKHGSYTAASAAIFLILALVYVFQSLTPMAAIILDWRSRRQSGAQVQKLTYELGRIPRGITTQMVGCVRRLYRPAATPPSCQATSNLCFVLVAWLVEMLIMILQL